MSGFIFSSPIAAYVDKYYKLHFKSALTSERTWLLGETEIRPLRLTPESLQTKKNMVNIEYVNLNEAAIGFNICGSLDTRNLIRILKILVTSI